MSEKDGKSSLAGFFYGAVTMGERGQVVIPAEARKQHHLHPGDKLLVFRHPHFRGVVLARLEDVRALLDELQQWSELVSTVEKHLTVEEDVVEADHKSGGGNP